MIFYYIDLGEPSLIDFRFAANVADVNDAFQNAQKLLGLQKYAKASTIADTYRYNIV